MIGALTISRDSSDMIRISIIDRASTVRFAELHMTLADFAMAITGQAHIDGELSVKDLHHVGKVRVVERRSIRCPLEGGREQLEQWLTENAEEEGWIVEPYLGSQGSVTRSGKTTMLNYSVKKYVAADGDSP